MAGDIQGIQGRSDITSVLNQMRAMQQATTSELNVNVRELDKPQAGQANFGTLLRSAIDSVATLQTNASTKADAFVRGDSKDLVDVMIAQQKSSVAFQALTQVRNRMVSAYQDIMNMPI